MDELKRIKFLDDKINNKLEEREQLYTLATKVSAPPLNPNKVQSSNENDKMANIVVKITMLDKEIDKLVDEFVDEKTETIQHIEALQELNDGKYYNLLYKRYVQYKKFNEIAREMGYSYQYVRQLHVESLEKFYKKVKVPTK